MALSDEECELIWSTAAEQEIGLIVPMKTEDIHRAMNDLYEWRKGRSGFENISIVLPHGGGRLFMVKRTVELE